MQRWTSLPRLLPPEFYTRLRSPPLKARQQWRFTLSHTRRYSTALSDTQQDDSQASLSFSPYRPFDDSRSKPTVPSTRGAWGLEHGKEGSPAGGPRTRDAPTRPRPPVSAGATGRRRRLFRTLPPPPTRRTTSTIVRAHATRKRRRTLIRLRPTMFTPRRGARRPKIRPIEPSKTGKLSKAEKWAFWQRRYAGISSFNLYVVWRRRLRSVDWTSYHKTYDEPERDREVPTLDVRTPEWVESLLERLNYAEQRLSRDDLSLAYDKNPSIVWMEVALWLLTYDPRQLLRFLQATHAESYMHTFFIDKSLHHLAQIWWHSTAPDNVTQLQKVAKVFCEVANRGSEDTLTFYNPFFRNLIRHCSDEQVQQMYRAIKGQGVLTHWSTYLHFASYFAKHDHFERSLEALTDAKNEGARLDSFGFRTVCVTILRKSSEQPDGLRVCSRIVSDIVDMGVHLDRSFCDVIMLNAVEAGDLKTAFSVYHSLVDRGLQAAESTFAILLKGCKMNIDDAVILNEVIRNAVDNMDVRKSDVVANEILHCLALHHSKHHPETALGTLTDAYAQFFDLRPLYKLGLPIPRLVQNHDDFMPASQSAMNFMIEASIQHLYTQSPYGEGILPIYERWRSHVEAGDAGLAQLATKDYTANIFLMAFIRRAAGLIHAARVIRDMQRPLPSSANVTQIQPTVQSWSIFLLGFTRHRKIKLAEQILNYMRSKGVEPNLVSWNTLIAGYARVQDEEGVLDAVRRGQQSGMVWNQWTFGGMKALRERGRLDVELERMRLERTMDFSGELKRELGERLEGQGSVGRERGVESTGDGVGTDGFADSPGEIAEQGSYRPF